jgi:hypothetical protein
MTKKYEPPFTLDMPFDEALQRFAATRPDEVKDAVLAATPKASENNRLSVKNVTGAKVWASASIRLAGFVP